MYFPEQANGERTKQLKRYKCCGQSVGDSAGCTTAQFHVFKSKGANQLAAVTNFAETPPNPSTPADRAVCFDCEMCYTVYGLELVRLTATSWPTGDLLLDVLVHPKGEILDLNSRFSGVWPEEFAAAEPWSPGDGLVPTAAQPSTNAADANTNDGSNGAKPSSSGPKRNLRKTASPEAARDLLFSLIGPDTPLIGHGLENDLNSVRVVHPTLIDTILLYPHRRGLPYRYGLKMLTETTLNRLIQVEDSHDVQGHDSAEDARAAGDLVRYKAMKEWEHMQIKGWTLVDGEFVAPGAGGKGATSGGSEEAQLTEEVLEEGQIS
jgi:hypothetical protein